MLCVCSVFFLSAQEGKEDTTVLKKFELISQKPGNESTGSVKINLPSGSSHSLADILNQYSALFVKYYSPVSLATVSMRGMGAQHTAVLWNGINLQSTMNGVMDFNLLPGFFIDQAELHTGANATSSPNGAIAGAIYLDNKPVRNNTVFTELQAGSFQARSYAAGVTYDIRRWTFRSRALYKESANDFEYVDYFKPGKPLEKLEHSRFRQYGGMQEIWFRPAKRHQLYLNAWGQATERQLPPVMGAALFHERQDDYSQRILLQHEWKVNAALAVKNKAAYIDERLNYFNDNLAPAYNHSRTTFAESELKYRAAERVVISASLNYTLQQAVADGYKDGRQRHIWSQCTRIDWKSRNERLKLSLANRQLIAGRHMAPSSPDFGFEYQVGKKLKLKGNAAYSFRIPTFNDLYWIGGGNPNLLPEKGRKAELSLEFRHKELKVSPTVFYQQVSNWIIWMPDTGSSLWRAVNARQVKSRGLELAAEYAKTILKHHSFKVFGRYQFVQSINTKVYDRDSTALGKQLFYTPVHTGFVQLRYTYKRFQFWLGSVYTGSRFTTSDNDRDYMMPAYRIMNAGIAYMYAYKKHEAVLGFLVNNIGNTTYQVIENRPMPMRNYQVTLKINIHYEKN